MFEKGELLLLTVSNEVNDCAVSRYQWFANVFQVCNVALVILVQQQSWLEIVCLTL